VVIASAVELLHNASLVHDDLQDRAMLRRGTETVWAAYGANLAVCTGDLLLSAAYAALASFSNSMVVPELMGLLHARTSQAIHGQCEDLSTEVRLIDLAAYERMVAGKSGALLRLPLELVFLGSGHREWLGRARQAAETFGLGYQIVDDLEDAEADAERFGDWPNILHVLRAKGNNAWTAARALGMQKLEEAEELAASLPNQSGALLQDLSRALRERL
jgi:geranylgeranyl pyrophosphate synthase